MSHLRSIVVIICTLGSLASSTAVAEETHPPTTSCESPGLPLHLDPSQVQIRFFYGGTKLGVTADLPRDEPAAVLFEGDPGHVKLREKGRVWGVLWMSVGDVEFEHIPTTYLLSTSAPVTSLGTKAARARAGIGYDALATRAGGDRTMFNELIKLKEQEELFAVDEGGVDFERRRAGGVRLSTAFHLPARTPAGTYHVRLIEFTDHEARCLGHADLPLAYGGLVQPLRTLAFEHGVLYGCTAVLIALVTGLVTGLIFGKGASQGH